MNNYELTLILNPDLSSKFDEFQSKFDKTLSDIGFEVKKLENIGRRQLAYSILNHNKGHYLIKQTNNTTKALIAYGIALTKIMADISLLKSKIL